MFITLNDFLIFDLMWLPIFISFFLFSFFLLLIKEPFEKVIRLNDNILEYNIKFLKKKFYDDYYNLIKFIYKFIILIYVYLFINNCYFYSYTNIVYFFNFQIYNYVWLYYIIINLIIIISLILLYNYLLCNIKKSFEFLLSIILFLNCLFYYLLLNNLIILIIIFEIQSLIFIYLLATNFTINTNFNNLYTMRYNNFTTQPI